MILYHFKQMMTSEPVRFENCNKYFVISMNMLAQWRNYGFFWEKGRLAINFIVIKLTNCRIIWGRNEERHKNRHS